MKTLVMLLVMAMAAILPAVTYAQGKGPLTKEQKQATYARAIRNAHHLMHNVAVVCKSEECRSLSVEGKRLISETVNRGRQGAIGTPELKQFHNNFQTHLTKVIMALDKDQKSKNQTARPNEPRQRELDLLQFPTDGGECDLCSSVYEIAVPICALNPNPALALICIGITTSRYMECLDKYCDNSFLPDWYINCCSGFGGGGGGGEEMGGDEGGEYIEMEMDVD
jgi:hypothetical protein